MAMLVRYDPPAIQRRPGRLRGQIELAPDCDDRRRRDGRSVRHRAVSALLADAHALLSDKLVVPEDLLQARAADGFLELASVLVTPVRPGASRRCIAIRSSG